MKGLLEKVIDENIGEKIDNKFDLIKEEIDLSNSIKEDYWRWRKWIKYFFNE